MLSGRRLALPARTGVMLPYGVRVGACTLIETTCELVRRDGGEVVLRPTQESADVAVFDTEPTAVDGGDVSADGARFTVTARAPTRSGVQLLQAAGVRRTHPSITFAARLTDLARSSEGRGRSRWTEVG